MRCDLTNWNFGWKETTNSHPKAKEIWYCTIIQIPVINQNCSFYYRKDTVTIPFQWKHTNYDLFSNLASQNRGRLGWKESQVGNKTWRDQKDKQWHSKQIYLGYKCSDAQIYTHCNTILDINEQISHSNEAQDPAAQTTLLVSACIAYTSQTVSALQH